MAGVSATGFSLRRLADIIESKNEALGAITDPDTGETLQLTVDAEDGPLGMIELIDAEADALVWEALQLVYNQFDPGRANMASLRGTAQLNGINQRLGSFSTVAIEVTGAPGTVVDDNRLIQTNSNVQFRVNGAIDIGPDGTGAGMARATERGPVAAEANSLTVIGEPKDGWFTVNNADAATPGLASETFPELRARRDRSTEAPSVGPVEATAANLLQLEGVTFARPYVNNTLATDARGLPPKTMAAVIVGGDPNEVARVLFLRNTGGLEYFGNDGLNITDTLGEPHGIRWITPPGIEIHVTVETTITDQDIFPADGPAQIQQAIVDYARAGRAALDISEGFRELGFVPGDDVAVSRLYTPVNSVPGHVVTRLDVSLTPGGVGQTVPINFDQIAAFDAARISVTAT